MKGKNMTRQEIKAELKRRGISIKKVCEEIGENESWAYRVLNGKTKGVRTLNDFTKYLNHKQEPVVTTDDQDFSTLIEVAKSDLSWKTKKALITSIVNTLN